ncbi:hypothetical protein IQ22_04252 [Pseudomonas duriflava]|jgi:septal ring factor EnvC (AmiA/AmiB activator)|uniref:Uncharacterized protein n=2 Tax=Pseudomonas TaxID=286 RepID=A0A562PUH7_9PSED|nr:MULTISPECIES: hypothetical protein [Pseudomonas]MBH3440519.1 hypothetical protein [Pseudomonas luteola]TWI48059.1 hypothetical protein IQ22_04252 [Pseudomonas duriflava]
MFESLPTDLKGWLGWVGMAVVTAIVYFPKVWGERRGDNKEIDRLSAALSEERQGRKDAEAKIQELMLRFFEQNATNARLEEQMKHLGEQNEELRQEISQLRAELQQVRGNA